MRRTIFIIISVSLFLGLIGLISCSNTPDKLLRIQENGLYGFVDTLGNVKIEPQYKYCGAFSKDGYALIISKAQILNDTLEIKYGFIDTNNKLVVDTINDLKIAIPELGSLWKMYDAETFVNKYNSSELGFMDSYFATLRVSQGLYQYINSNNIIGYKNLKGEVAISAKYKYAGPFVENVAIVSEGITLDPNKSMSDNLNTFSLINDKGEYIKEKAWAYIPPFSKAGLTWCCEINLEEDENGNLTPSLVWTQIDRAGKITIGPVNGSAGSKVYNGFPDNDGLYVYYFPDIFGMHVGYSFINNDGKFATDKNGDNEITMWGEDTEVFDDVTSFSEGFAGVKVFIDDESRWTFMTPKFEIATKELYDSVKPFTDNLAVVQQMNTSIKHLGDWGVIDKNFNTVIPYKFSEISSFSHGFAYAKIRSTKYDREGWINRQGVFIWETNRRK